MKLQVNRTGIRLSPDFTKVIPRFFNTGDERSLALIHKVLQMPDKEAEDTLLRVFDEFSKRYRNIEGIFEKHFDLIRHLLPEKEQLTLSKQRKLLIGSYFTMEYSLEAAALFNPSIVEDPDQSGTTTNEKNVIISLRATGEGHISSLVFKRGKLDKNSMIHFESSGRFVSEGLITEKKRNNKAAFEELLSHTVLPGPIRQDILHQLHDTFSYKELESILKNALRQIDSATERKKLKYDILSMVNTSYEVNFPADSLISERVIFPVTFTEKNGIEDARFVKFTAEDGTVRYIATYTAYDGSFILPHLIETKDFLRFKVSALHGKAAINKGMALFPRKVNGQYVMLARIDGINNYIMFSDDLYLWETATLLQHPQSPWEFVQIGNGGSPIETVQGWLVITHGVGPMRKYCLGASLLDLNDPSKELGRLKEPLLMPNEEERHGYVPNVVYSCGSFIHGDNLFIPYAVSDHATSFATVSLSGLLDEIMSSR
jgi:predicted GH43/DUF377 family glycosyl hydrolase